MNQASTSMPDPIEITDPDFVHSVAERTSRLMTLHRVPVTPRNYEVWFNYVRGTSPALRRTIDVLIANHREFDASTNHELSTHFGNEKDGAAPIPEQFKELVANAERILSTAVSDNRVQIASLDRVASQAAHPAADLGSIIAGLQGVIRLAILTPPVPLDVPNTAIKISRGLGVTVRRRCTWAQLNDAACTWPFYLTGVS